MLGWRITKYSPKYRDLNGTYIFKEWTDNSDVGAIFNNEILTMQEYEQMEKKYILAIAILMEQLKVNNIEIASLEESSLKFKNDATPEMKLLRKQIKKEMHVTTQNINSLSKLILRNYMSMG